ncbi:LysR substrate-binding domain-containing protein [Rhizobium laguerreae]|uniref:LysR substrate-binding domain-containing protein n=1 Tax=Rhizobium laguerreae TaxID=1076926 RepID=UPI0028AC7567|nr:LysR substrate-binding domain-containing protein [Rhizobium laguerreae]
MNQSPVQVSTGAACRLPVQYSGGGVRSSSLRRRSPSLRFQISACHRKFSTNQGAALRMAALSSAGVALQPEVLLAADIAEGRLEQVLPEWSYKPVPMHLIYVPNRRPTAMLRTVIDFLVDRFG